MRKNYFLLAAAVTMLTGCTNNEKMTNDLSYDGQVLIGFETFHEKATKAATTPTGEISAPEHFTKGHGGFGVWGFKGDPSDIPAATEAADYTINISNTTKFVPIFENVQVWYVDASDATYKPKGFTYTVPKYWDKKSEYIFFAYAPYNGTKNDNSQDIASLDKTTGKIVIRDIESIQDLSKSSGSGVDQIFGGTGTDHAYVAADATGVIDYLMAKYETEQKFAGTNQDNKNWDNYKSDPDLRDQTVGFTFGHMLSRIIVNLQAAEPYKGVASIDVTYLTINNMPEVKTDKAVFTQTSPTAAAGTYSPSTWAGKTLQIINTDGTANANASAKNALYILKNGAGKTAGNETTTNADLMATIVNLTPQPQSFYYYVAPSTANNTETDEVEKYTLNIKYTITYVDGKTEVVIPEPIDLSSKLTEFVQNYSYTLNISVALNQIYFTVDAVQNWSEQTAIGVEVK